MTARVLPTGRVTFLFTDIEGSTRLVGQLGVARWSPLLARHRELVRGALAGNAGIEVKTEGDGFFAVFSDPVAAIAAVADAQRALAAEAWPDDAPIRVRMGLHAGEGVLDADGDYVGPDVHRAARVAAAGSGGQVVLSASVADAVAAALPAGVGLRALGRHRLKDLTPEPLWDLVVAGLPSEFAPLRSLDARPNNLPVQLTSFVGRERELAELRTLLERTRLLTLTGPGGTGKTRLSLQLAADVAERFADGVTFVPLAAIRDPDLVLPAIATELGLAEMPDRAPADVLAEALDGKDALLVLDNLEQVVAAGPALADLLVRLPRLRMVTSSRAALRVSGEQEYPVPGLSLPAPGEAGGPDAPDPELLLGFQAVRLFVDRASAVRPGFRLGPDSAAAVLAICERLDGMPLAIELAAARTRVLPPATILERLGRALDLLAGGSRDLPERQRSLRGAIAWSHDLLDPPCRRLFERLAVFADGAELADAEAVCGPAADLGQDVLDGLTTLVDQSLVRAEETDDGPRFRLLEPIREFALERLEASGEAEAVRDRHAERYTERLVEAAPYLLGEDQRRWLDRLARDHQNIRAAIEHAVAADEPERAARAASAAWRYWQIRGHLVGGSELVDRVLAMPSLAAHPEQHVLALEAAGGLAWWRGDYPACSRAYAAALELRRAGDDKAALAAALYNVAFPMVFSREGVSSRRLFEEARDLYREVGDADGEARAWWGIANSSYAEPGSPAELDRAREAVGIAQRHFRAAGMRFDLAWSLYTAAQIELTARRPEAALAPGREALELFHTANDVPGIAMTLDAAAGAEWLLGRRERSAMLSGAVARLERQSGAGLNPVNRQLIGFDPEALRSDPALAAAWQAGESAPLEGLVEQAFAPDAPAPA